jgi:surface protein
MEYMFAYSKFNKDISKWNVSKVKNMKALFRNTRFCHDLTDWTPIKLESLDDIFEDNKSPIPYLNT